MSHSNKKTRRIVALLLAISLCAGVLCSCGKSSDAMLQFKKNNLKWGIADANTELFPGYEHYDPSEYYEKCDRLSALVKEGKDLDTAWSIYDEVFKDAVLVRDYRNTATVGLDENTKSDYFNKEKVYTDKLCVEMFDKIKTVCSEIANGSLAEAFKKHIANDFLFDLYRKYKPLSDSAKELMNRESELKNQYVSVSAEVNAAAEKDDFDYKAANEKLGKIFLDLVSVRKQIAKEMGYSDYAQYADREIYLRDYTEQDLEALKNATKKYGKNFDHYFYNVFYDYDMSGITPEMVITDVGDAVTKLSKKADYFYTYLTDNGLLSYGSEACRNDSDYTVGFASTDSAAIIAKVFNDSFYDNYRIFAHELGHFCNMMTVKNDVSIFVEDGCMDVLELHSTFLETLFAAYPGDIFTSVAGFQGYEIAWLASLVASGCYYDDWQREIYKSERDMTLDEINALFKKICLEYGVEEYENMEYDWMWVGHNFDVPMYYISYATTAFASLELWNIAQKNLDKAIGIWEKSLSENQFRKGHMDVVRDLKLTPFNDADNADKTFAQIVEFLKKAEAQMIAEENAGATATPYAVTVTPSATAVSTSATVSLPAAATSEIIVPDVNSARPSEEISGKKTLEPGIRTLAP